MSSPHNIHLCYVGSAEPLTDPVIEAAFKALKCIHSCGILHKDIRWSEKVVCGLQILGFRNASPTTSRSKTRLHNCRNFLTSLIDAIGFISAVFGIGQCGLICSVSINDNVVQLWVPQKECQVSLVDDCREDVTTFASSISDREVFCGCSELSTGATVQV